MRSEIIKKLKTAQFRIRGVICCIECNGDITDALCQIRKVKKIIQEIKNLYLEDYLKKVAKRTRIPKKEILKYYNLLN